MNSLTSATHDQYPRIPCAALHQSVEYLSPPTFILYFVSLVTIAPMKPDPTGSQEVPKTIQVDSSHTQSIPPLQMISFLRQNRAEGTGAWFIESPEFVSWVDGSVPLFVLEGIPGSGKTYMTQLVFDSLLDRYRGVSGHVALLHFIEYRPLIATMTVGERIAEVLSSLLTQISVAQDVVLPTRNLVATPLEYLIWVFKQAVSPFAQVGIVLDGLNELDAGGRAKLLSIILTLGPSIKLFVTSRPLPLEVYDPSKKVGYSLQCSNAQDVQLYLRDCLKRERDGNGLREVLLERPDLSQEIIQVVTAGCRSLLLLARLQMSCLMECQTYDELTRRLAVLPSTPREAYLRAISRIEDLDPIDMRYAKHALIWVLYAKTRLSLTVLLDAVAASTPTEHIYYHSIKSAKTSSIRLLNLCGGLIVERGDEVVFAHPMVYDFLVENQSRLFGEDPHTIIATGCFRYMTPGGENSTLPLFSENDAFMTYCFEFAREHATESKSVATWSIIASQNPSRGRETDPVVIEAWRCGAAAFIGDRNMVQGLAHILESTSPPLPQPLQSRPESFVSQCRQSKDFFLHMAAFNGDVEVVEALLSLDCISPIAQDHKQSTPLHRAAEQGHVPVVRLLASLPGIDLNSKDKFRHTPLHLAAKEGRLPVIEFLVSLSGVDRNVQNHLKQTPFFLAASQGHLHVVQFLSSLPDVGINGWDDQKKSPLSLAAQGGHLSVVQFLASLRTAQTQDGGRHFRAPLFLAAQHGQLPVVKFLATHFPLTVHDHDQWGQTPMYHAASHGHLPIVQFFVSLPRGDAFFQSDENQRCLVIAVRQGHRPVVEFLASLPDVDVNARDEFQRTPFLLATKHGRLPIVQFLATLDNVDVNASGASSFNETALHLAVKQHNFPMVEFLVSLSRTDLNSRNLNGQTPLFLAVAAGDLAMVQFLSSLPNIDLTAQDNLQQTPLHITAKNGFVSIAQCLLGLEKVDIDIRDYDNETPLSLAVRYDHHEVVRLLEDHPRTIS